MPINTTTIFLFIVFASLGAAVGAILQRAQDRRESRLAPPPQEPAAPVPPAATEPALPPVNKLASDGDAEILRAWRSLSGKVWLEMDGTRLDGKESLQTDQRRRLVSLLLDLRPWLENGPASSIGPETQPRSAPRVETPELEALRQAVAAVSPARKSNPPADEKKPAPVVLKSIVEQIDEVLQDKLASGVFKDREISLTEGPGGVVIVKVGLKKYEGIDAVPEPEIQALIRQAVAEWEKK
jgi:hypothetical protein